VAIGMLLDWDGVGEDQYTRVLDALRLDDEPVDGLLLHTAGAKPDGWRVFDVWRSEDHFNRFVDERLKPAVAQAGIEAPPQPQVSPVYNLFAPGAQAIGQAGASARPDTTRFPEN
jgi:hypothetical protein